MYVSTRTSLADKKPMYNYFMYKYLITRWQLKKQRKMLNYISTYVHSMMSMHARQK